MLTMQQLMDDKEFSTPSEKQIQNCLQKTRHDTEAVARRFAEVLIEINKFKSLWYYKCPNCHGYHVTKNDTGDHQKVESHWSKSAIRSARRRRAEIKALSKDLPGR